MFARSPGAMASIQEIAELMKKNNQELKTELKNELKDELVSAITSTINATIDAKFATHVAKMFSEIKKLQDCATALEQQSQAPDSTGSAWKRARSAPASRRGASKQPCVVLTGFPYNSKKSDVEKFVTDELKKNPTWSSLKPFAPGIRSSVALIRISDLDAAYEFIDAWRSSDHTYKDREIRARTERPPEQRKSNAKIDLINEFLRREFPGVDLDTDFKNACVWADDGAVVTWDIDEERFSWDDGVLQSAGMGSLNKESAEQHTQRK